MKARLEMRNFSMIAAASLLVGLWLALVAPAGAGEYHVYSCRTPTGSTAPTDGWSGSITGSWNYDPNSCASGGSLTGELSGGVSHPANESSATWVFSAPSGTQIAAARLWRTAYAHSWQEGATSTVDWLAAPEDSYTSADVFSQCALYGGCSEVGNPNSPMAGENLVEMPPGNASGASHIYMNAACGGFNGYTCPAIGGGYSAAISLYAADITLADDTPPTASSVGGSLTAGGTISGFGDVSFAAADTGSGLYQAVFSIDGRAVSNQLLDSGSGSCRNVGGTGDGSNAFLHVQPCPLALSDDLAFDTALASDGSHLLTVALLDGAGNATTILNRQVKIVNHPVVSTPTPPGPIATGPGNGGGTPITSAPSSPTSVNTAIAIAPSTSASVLAPGSANGTNASDQARLTARWASTAKATRTSRYGAADRVTGRLSSAAGQAISGAVLDVYETPAYEGARTVELAGVRTGPTGSWRLTLPRDVSSSTLRFEYHSHLDDTVAAASATLRLSVHAGIALRIAPHIASVGRKIFFSGAVHGGPIPQGGKQLVLEARSGREGWIPFETIRTNANGGYRASYRFKLSGNIVYQFKVLSRYEGDFPFLDGVSNVVDVHEH